MPIVEIVVPVTTPVPELYVSESVKLSSDLIKLIDRVENIWDGPGGPGAIKTAVQNIIGLIRMKTMMWLNEIETTKSQSGLDMDPPRQSPGHVIASVGNSNSNNPVQYTAERAYAKVKERLSKLFSTPGKGGIRLSDIANAKLVLDLTLQRVKNKYSCGEGIVHTNFAE